MCSFSYNNNLQDQTMNLRCDVPSYKLAAERWHTHRAYNPSPGGCVKPNEPEVTRTGSQPYLGAAEHGSLTDAEKNQLTHLMFTD